MKNKICKISLFSMMLACAMNTPADARISVKNSASYANAYNQVMAVRQQNAIANGEYAANTENLPVAVDNEKLAHSIATNTAENVTTSDLANCAMIYPTGLFRWGIPASGVRRNQLDQCIAVVELRDVNTNTVLAQTTLASGDTMKCNIDMFPQIGWMSALEKFELPADAAPTMEDVEKVMNQEQKQNAGFKIAAAAIISGIAGNMLAPKQAGDTKLVGTGKRQLVDTAISATAGAGIMAASTYSGKVAGDTIKSTAVNAATGAVIGNMKAGMNGSDTTLEITKCNVEGFEKDCVVGTLTNMKGATNYTTPKSTSDTGNLYLINKPGTLLSCQRCTKNASSGSCQVCTDDDKNDDYCGLIQPYADVSDLVYHKCREVSSNTLLDIQLSTGSYKAAIGKEDTLLNNAVKFSRQDDTLKIFKEEPEHQKMTGDNIFYLVTSAKIPKGGGEPGYAVFDNLPNKLMGYQVSDYEALAQTYHPTFFARNHDGSVGKERTSVSTTDSDGKSTPAYEPHFEPMGLGATDGALVDFSNSGRMKATLTGAAAGGALGGFSGYEGAKQEIQERWVSAVREYDDSLNMFYCGTGTRYLAPYNSYVEIPAMQTNEQK